MKAWPCRDTQAAKTLIRQFVILEEPAVVAVAPAQREGALPGLAGRPGAPHARERARQELGTVGPAPAPAQPSAASAARRR